MTLLKRHKNKLIASLLITLGIWYTLHKGGLKIFPEGGDFNHVRWWTVAVYLGTMFVYTWFRAVRWRFLLRSMAEVSKKRLFIVSCVGFVAILILPFRIGEVVRPYMVRTPESERRPGERPVTMTAATSSVVAERVIDGLYLSIILALALFLVPTVHPLPETVVGLHVSVAFVRMVGYAMLGVFLSASMTIAVFYFARAWAHRMTLRVFGQVSAPLAERLATLCEKFADGLHVLGSARDALGFLAETTIYWFVNAAGMCFLAWGCGVVHADGTGPTFGEACALMGMLGCAIIIPGPPGALGAFQAGLYAAMTMFYPTAVVIGPGAAYVFLLYASQVIFTLVAGAIALAASGRVGEGGLRVIERAEAMVGEPADAQ